MRRRQNNPILTGEAGVGKTAVVEGFARRVAEADALSHVFGYSVMIDVSARDNRRAGQWIYSKGMDSFAPFGPSITGMPRSPGSHGSTGTQGCILR